MAVLQSHLFESPEPDRTPSDIVNVASIPQRSPFRYPGGKTWLIPKLRLWLRSLAAKPVEFVEPFAGGGIVSLTVAFEQLSHHVTMVELDSQVSAVWETILNNGCQRLAKRIMSFDVTPESVEAELAKKESSREDLAFKTILRNRVNHGGILAPGSGVIKHGENGKGIKSRWYPATLCKRISNIEHVKDRLQFINGDGLSILKESAHRSDFAFFIDPPYTAAGKKAGRRLYTHNELDHEMLFKIAESLQGNFLMTYDNADGVIDLARRHNLDTELIAMKNTHHASMTELLVGRDLNWARSL